MQAPMSPGEFELGLVRERLQDLVVAGGLTEAVAVLGEEMGREVELFLHYAFQRINDLIGDPSRWDEGEEVGGHSSQDPILSITDLSFGCQARGGFL